MKNNDKYILAKSEFNKAINKISKKELLKYKDGCGISAWKFAIKYIKPEQDQNIYNKIYNIYYDYFNQL
jgi:hypothetical protein